MDRELFDALGDPTFIHDETGRCVAANLRACAMFGGDEAALMAGGTTMFSAAEDGFTGERASDQLALARRDGEATFEWRSRRADGSAFWSEVHLVTAQLDDQPRVVARVRDITPLKETAARLELAQQLYALVVRSLPGSVILLYDRDLRFVLADGPEIEATGFSKAGLEGKTLYEALPTAFARVVEPNLRAALAGQTLPLQLPYEDRWYSYNYVPVFDDEGAVIYGMVVGVNVTERYRAESALQASEARLRAITTHTPAYILEVAADGTIAYLNRPLPGTGAEAGLGHPIWPWIRPDHVEALRHALHRASVGEVASLDFVFEAVGSEPRELAAVLAPLPLAEPGRIVMTAIDVTERKRVQAERERLIRELTDRNAEMEQFTYTVSHDLKSPLVTIRGFLGMLERDLALGRADNAKADLSRIGSAADKMSRLLNDLLELSRVGRAGNPEGAVRLADVAREAVELLEGRISERGATVRIADPLPVIVGDRTRMIQVVQNLVENALKYGGDQPNPTVTIGTRDDPDAAVFYVSDQGIGVDPKYSERIFGLFEKLDPRADGTGIGLALVRRIIEQHHGRVWVESEGPGRGSTFVIRLPRAAAGS